MDQYNRRVCATCTGVELSLSTGSMGGGVGGGPRGRLCTALKDLLPATLPNSAHRVSRRNEPDADASDGSAEG